jgi:endonuclease/exonuclease/phosphatase family metal-dependent hydrolase
MRLPRTLALVAAAACASSPVQAPEWSLRVMTYNIAAGRGDLSQIERTIRESGAEVVALQEVDVHWSERSGFADQAAVLGQRLGMHVRFAPIYRLPAQAAGRPPREYGVALLSRHPVVHFTNHQITRLSTQDTAATPTPMPGFLEARVQVHGNEVRVFNTHLDYRSDPAVRRTQVSEMLAMFGDHTEPTLLFGDLNARPDADELQPLFTRLRDAWRVTEGPGYTYPATAPDRRIDFVLVSDQFEVRRAEVLPSKASDHQAVVAELQCCRVSIPR